MAVRRVAIGIWLLAAGLCIVQIAHTRFVADLSSFLPETPTAEQRFLVEQLREGAIARVMLIGIEGADASTRAALSRRLGDALRAASTFTSVGNGTATGFERDREFLFNHRYALGPRVSPRLFEVDGLRAAISETIDRLASPAGLLLKPLVPRDPTGEMLSIADSLQPADAPRLVEGAWASRSGDRALLLAQTRASAADIDAQARALANVERAFGEAVAATGAAARGARLLVTGPGVFSARSRALIERDVALLTACSALIVVTLLLAVYRSPIALGLGLVPVVSGALAGIAAVSLGFGVVHGITLGFGTTLIGEAIDYSIYLFVQAERGERAGDRAWLAGFWPTIRLGVLTSIAGFCALLFSGLPGLAQLGLYSITGLAAAAAVTRFVLPALLPAEFRIRDVSTFAERLRDQVARASRWRIVIVVATGAAAIVLAAKHEHVWDSQLMSLNPIEQRERAIDAQLRTEIGASDARYMIAAQASTAEGALEAAESIGGRLDELVAADRIGGYASPARILPSMRTQRSRLDSLPDAATLRARLRAALAGLPLRPEKLEPFVEDVERARSGPLLGPADVTGTTLDAALGGLLFRDKAGEWTSLVALRPGPQAPAIDVEAVRRAVAASGVARVIVLDLKSEADRLYAGYFRRAIAMSGIGLIAIVLLLWGALRRPSRVARVMLPLIAAVLVVAAGHVLAGTRLTLLHLVGLLLVVAIGSNYALFFDRIAESHDRDASRTLVSLALANATTVASFGVLSISEIAVLRAIGSTVAAGALIALLFTVALYAPRGRTAPGSP